MRLLLRFIVFITFASATVAVKAQKMLVEGTVVYRAILTNPDGSRKEGTYTITVKNKQVRKEIKIGADFGNVQLLDNTQKAYTLRSINDKNLAVEMSMEDMTRKNEKYYNPVIKELPEHKTIAGLDVAKAIFSYKDGSTSTVFYTKDWMPEMDFTFERFHGLKGFPLAFDYKNDQGVVITFEAISFNEDVVENANFKVPAGYKVIGSEEYKRLKSE